MRNNRKLCFVILAMIVLTSCNDKKVIEDLAIISMISFDRIEGEEGKLKVTASFPDLSSETSQKDEIIETVANSKKEAEDLLSSKTRQQVVNGQIHSIIIGRTLAEEGVSRVITSMERDQEIGSQVKLVMAFGEGEEIIKTDVEPDVGSYVDKMLKTETDKFTIPEMDIFHFSRDYFDDGIDPVAPLFTKEDDDLVLKGTALFREDQYVAHLDLFQSKVFLFLLGKVKKGELTIKIPDGDNIRNLHFDYIKSNRKIKVVKSNGKVDHIQIKVKMRGSVIEDTGAKDISSTIETKKIEKVIAKHIEDDGEGILKVLKENHTDSLGLGRYIRHSLSYEEWKKLDKYDYLETIPVSVSVDVTIKDTGMSQ
ncbi:Ger(x)C family spore germination protein [Anaerobacillus sp. 1_MG-2023]|uniref:Ger(x)C family spore germination protein n=1 Tax=Bacillales TaxID=1385 RepID=UPI0026E1A88E|nr:Ger(x)C family spore germination protein [Anaerobacillus sp. 1_MG-2023]MDO6658561.1 Ger(x)C family spore germination protein [Anaerobacillus sp. 1_MG-2023]